jgi:hypothetical protein
MDTTKYHRLRNDCFAAIQNHDNLEQCCYLLLESLDERESAFTEITAVSGRLRGLLSENNLGTISFEEYTMHRNRIRKSLLTFLDSTLRPEDVSLLRRIHERILIVVCKNSPTNWEKLFPDAFFSHAHIIRYGDEVPAEFSSPDVVIFDDLECPGIGNDAEIRRLARSMPGANLLYYGQPGENIFKKKNASEEDQGFAARCADANSKFTLHARLRELLEFRKIYGPIVDSNG